MDKQIKSLVNNLDSKYQFTFIDVGAMDGIPFKWSKLSSEMRIVAFEPDPRAFAKLKENNSTKYFNYALSNTQQSLRYFIAREPGKSSIFKPNKEILSQYRQTGRYEIVKEEDIPWERVKKLDSLIEENSISDADFIKLDTQGSELLILEGGQNKTLPKVFGIQTEVEFTSLYENQPLFRDLDRFMDENGFELIDIKRHYWKRKDYYKYRGKGQLIFGDALYFKKIGILEKQLIDINDKAYVSSKILKSIIACMIYGVFDYAVSLINLGKKLGCFSLSGQEEILCKIKECSRSGIPLWFHFSDKVYNGLKSLLDKLKHPSYLGWADSDREIANIKDR